MVYFAQYRRKTNSPNKPKEKSVSLLIAHNYFDAFFILARDLSHPEKDKSLHGLLVALGILGTIAGVVVAFAYGVADSGFLGGELQTAQSQVIPIDNPTSDTELPPSPAEDPDVETVKVETTSPTQVIQNDTGPPLKHYASLNYTRIAVSTPVEMSQETNVVTEPEPEVQTEPKVHPITFGPSPEVQEEEQEDEMEDEDTDGDAAEDPQIPESEPTTVPVENDELGNYDEETQSDDGDDPADNKGKKGKNGSTDEGPKDFGGKGKRGKD